MKYLSEIAITSCRQPLKTITRGEWTPSVIVIKNLNYAVNFKIFWHLTETQKQIKQLSVFDRDAS